MPQTDAKSRTRILLGIAGLILLGIVAISYVEWREYSRANAAATQTQNTVDALERLLSSLTDAETGQRGFLLTGENRYLQAYNAALQTIPGELADLRSRLTAHAEQSANWTRLNSLVGQRLAALREAVRQRQAQSVVSTAALDDGKRLMDDVRELCVRLERAERSLTSRASQEGEAAAATALLTTVVAALALFFLFSIGQAPAISVGSRRTLKPAPIRYGAAILAAAGAVMLRQALTPLIGPIELGFSIPLVAVLFSAWFGGLGCGAVCTMLSGFGSAYYFADPVGSLLLNNRSDQISLLIFVVLGFGISLLADSQRRAVERAARAETAERVERQRFQTTLTSIGDAVIATDAQGRVTFANRVALSLLRWPEAEIPGRPIGDVFRIVNEYSRAAVESPVDRVLREGKIVGLANHTILITRDGTEVPIDDSAAPIRDHAGSVQGAVLVFRDISERRRAEAEGRLLASIVESSEDAILSEDRQSVITSWNKGAERMFGFRAAEIIGQSISILSPSDRAGEVPAIRERILRAESIEQFQTVRQTKNGERLHASITISPIRDTAGRVTGASKIIRDITPQIEAQAKVAEHRERLRVTLRSIGDGVITTDTTGRVSYLNPVAERLTGWTTEQGRGRPLEEIFRIVNEHSRDPVENPVARVLREGNVVGLANHTVLISRHGREISIDDSAAPILDAQSRMIGAVLVFRDTTEKRAAEAELEQSEQRLAMILQHLPVGVAVIDAAGQVVIGNPVWRQFLPGDDIQSVGDGENTRWHAVTAEGHSLPRSEYPIVRALAGEDVLPGIDFLYTNANNQERWMRMSAVPWRESDGRIAGALTLLQDIDEVRRADERRAELLAQEAALAAERALRKTEAELARVLRALSVGELATSIAHEINQPLAGVLTNAEAALRWLGGETPDVPEARASLALISRDANRASAVIRRIREFLRKEMPQTVPLDLSDVVRESVALAAADLQKRHIVVSIELPHGLPWIRGDRVQLQQVILNLVLNAAEAMAGHTSPRELRVTAERSADGLVVIAVHDSGVGTKPENLPHMFEAFYSTKTTGMGMGLSISRSIIEAHGGRIWAELNDGPGLTVRFGIPAEAASQKAGSAL